MGDTLDVSAEVLLKATRAKLAELAEQEQAAIDAGDAETAVQRRGERMMLTQSSRHLEEQRARRDAVLAAAHSRGGPPTGQGLLLQTAAQKALELRGPDGIWPTQEDLADALGVSSRQVRKLGKYSLLLEAAEALAGT